MERREEGGSEDVGKRGRAWRAGRWRAAAAIVLWWRMRGRDRSEGLAEEVGASGWWVGGVMSFEVIVAGGLNRSGCVGWIRMEAGAQGAGWVDRKEAGWLGGVVGT